MDSVKVSKFCPVEVEWARNYGMEKIRLILYDDTSKAQVFSGLVGLEEVVEFSGDPLQEGPPKHSGPTSLPSSLDLKKNQVLLDLSYHTTPPSISERVATVGEAFGVGVDESKEFTIFDNLTVGYDESDLIYCTGDSGSGKSTFLRLFKDHLIGEGFNCVDFDDLEIDPNEVVIDGVGASKDEAMFILGVVGLSEAFLMVRRYKELSEGQRYRYRLGKLLSLEADAYFIDEFGATLDRIMAKVLGYCVQKWARRKGKILIVASTHDDLIEDFNPDTLIYKGFGEGTRVSYFSTSRRPISLIRDMKIEEASVEDWNLLERFHYVQQGKVGFLKGRWKITHLSNTVGVIVYTAPFLQVRLRNNVMPEYRGTDKAKKVNQEIVRIARIVVHPKYRGCGLAQELVKRTMPLTNMRIVETIAAMPKYNPFFEKAGLTKVGIMDFQPYQKKLTAFIEGVGGNFALLHSKVIRKTFLNGLNPTQMSALISILEYGIKSIKGQGKRGASTAKRYRGFLANGNLDACLGAMIPIEKVYLYWVNPQWTG